MTHRPRLVTAPLLACLAILPGLSAQELKTPAEDTDFKAGPTMYEPLMQFVYELESRSDLMSVHKITETLRGRDVVLCTLSNPAVRRPADALNTNKPIVLFHHVGLIMSHVFVIRSANHSHVGQSVIVQVVLTEQRVARPKWLATQQR